jgi:nucleotide-binding universal stress UspA family protein
MTPSRSVVVGYNGSPASVAAAHWGYDYCALSRRALLLVCAAPADDLVDELDARAAGPKVPITAVVDRRRPADGLLEHSASAELLVLGVGEATHPRELGGLTEHLAATALCPVITVRAGHRPGTAGGIAVGASDSVAGRLAMRFAVAEATRTGLPLTVVGNDLGQDPAQLPGWIRSVTDGPELSPAVRTLQRAESPADVLVEESESQLLTVVGSHHSTDPWSIRLGPVAEAVFRRSSSPVALVGHLRRRLDK